MAIAKIDVQVAFDDDKRLVGVGVPVPPQGCEKGAASHDHGAGDESGR
ncbi:MAG TPA: hypothetical protein VIJ16_02255 [Gemmatimonadaceae bacterium]